MAGGVLSDWLMGVKKVPFCFNIETAFIAENSSDNADPKDSIEKVLASVFDIVESVNMYQDQEYKKYF